MLLSIPTKILIVIIVFAVIIGIIALVISLTVSNAGKFITPADKPKDEKHKDENGSSD